MARDEGQKASPATKPPAVSTPLGVDSRYIVTFTANNGLQVSVMAGAASATLTNGFGGWEEVDRPKRPGMTRWKGKPLFRQDIPVLFDSYNTSKNVEVAIATLIRMSQQAGTNTTPPTVKINGPVERTDLTWVIENITWGSDEVFRDVQSGASVRVRQGAVVHLLQYVDDKVILTPAKPRVATKQVDAKGKTPKQLSQEYYGTPDFWKIFTDANSKVFTNPRQKAKKGAKVKVPSPYDFGGGMFR